MARIVRTNDAARRLEYTYRFKFGGGARLPMIGAGSVLIPVALVASWVVVQPLGWLPMNAVYTFLLQAALATAMGVGGSVLLLRKVGRNVNRVTTLGFWRQALTNELNTPRPDNTRTVEVIDLDRDVVFADDKPQPTIYTVTALPPIPSTVASTDTHH